MTKNERNKPQLIEKQKSRIKRIALGSGQREKDVSDLLKRFNMMRQIMQTTRMQPNLLSKIPGFKQIGQIAKFYNSRSNNEEIENVFSPIKGNSTNMFNYNTKTKQSNARTQISAKIKKLKRKNAKNARKKSKKKK